MLGSPCYGNHHNRGYSDCGWGFGQPDETSVGWERKMKDGCLGSRVTTKKHGCASSYGGRPRWRINGVVPCILVLGIATHRKYPRTPCQQVIATCTCLLFRLQVRISDVYSGQAGGQRSSRSNSLTFTVEIRPDLGLTREVDACLSHRN